MTALPGELTLLDLIRVATYLIVILQLFKFSSFVSFNICYFPEVVEAGWQRECESPGCSAQPPPLRLQPGQGSQLTVPGVEGYPVQGI